MTSATADKAEQTTEQVTFISRSPNQIVTRIPEDVLKDNRGRTIEQINRTTELRKLEEEDRIRRANGDTPVDERRIAHIAAPWKIEFGADAPPNNFVTDDPVLIDFLRNHENFGLDGPSGFWELETSPDELMPAVPEEHALITAASARGDISALEAIIETEKEKEAPRDAVLKDAEAALAILREIVGQAAPAGDDNQTGDPPSTSGS